MKPPIFSITDEGYFVLECPQCRGENIHQREVNIFNRDNPDAPTGEPEGTHVAVDSTDVLINRNLFDNPSPNRQGMTIRFYCEQCPFDAPAPLLGIWQHKGWTKIAWVNEDMWQKWQVNAPAYDQA